MHKKTCRNMVSMAFVTVMLLCSTAQPVLAWGELTHYSINKDADSDSTEELSAAVAPDALHVIPYRISGLGTLVHEELPGVLYGPLDPFLCNAAATKSQKRWAIGWITHTTADRSAHGTIQAGSPYFGYNNYIYSTSADTLPEHMVAELGGDILSYWFHEGTMPERTVVYPDQVTDSFADFDSFYNTEYSEDYDPDRYLEAFKSQLAVVWAEQVMIDIGLDKRLQFYDLANLVWAWRNYREPYDKYYQYAIGDVKEVNCLQTGLQSMMSDTSVCGQISEQTTDGPVSTKVMSKAHQAEYARIKVDAGRQLIDDKLVIPHREHSKETGAVTFSFKKTVSDRELAKAYKQSLEKTYEKRTGKKIKLPVHVTSGRKHVTINDVKENHPELYQKLIEKGVILSNLNDKN